MSTKKKVPFKQLLKASWAPYRLLAGYLKRYRKRFILGLICGIGYALLNGSLPFVIYFVAQQVFGAVPLGQVGGAQSKPKLPGLLGDLQDKVHLPEWLALNPGLAGVLAACILIPLVMIVRSLLSYGNAYCMAWVSLKMLRDLRRDLFGNIITQSMDFFNKAKSGNLMSRVANDTRTAQTAFMSVASDIFRDPISVATGVVALVYIDWKFCIAMLVLFPVCLVPVAIFGRKVRHAGRAEESQAGAISVILHETLGGIRVIKSFAREPYQIKQFESASDQQFRTSMKVRKTMDVVHPLIETVAAFGIALALLYVFFFNVEVAKIAALLFGTFLLYEPLKKVSRIHMVMQMALAASTNVFALLQQQPTIRDSKKAETLQRCAGKIEFDRVSFEYAAGQRALNDVSLVIEPGKQFALVGSSGAGKSTMLSMLLRFYDPQDGVIRLDGRDVRSVTQASLRENIGIVTQDTFLFHDSIYENIRYGRLNASKDEVIAAAKMAYAHDFIEAQPEGYQTVIGDKGCMLSGGQQQRLSIARALLKNAPILLLDEATSALDSESERMIQAALERLVQGKTVIAIAHRLSTILKSDQIVVMDHGRVVAVGPHGKLLEESAIYRKLYEMQFHHEDELIADVVM